MSLKNQFEPFTFQCFKIRVTATTAIVYNPEEYSLGTYLQKGRARWATARNSKIENRWESDKIWSSTLLIWKNSPSISLPHTPPPYVEQYFFVAFGRQIPKYDPDVRANSSRVIRIHSRFNYTIKIITAITLQNQFEHGWFRWQQIYCCPGKNSCRHLVCLNSKRSLLSWIFVEKKPG